MIIAHKEIKINGIWHHWSVVQLQDDSLWETMHKDGCILRRVATPATWLDVEFHGAECPMNYFSHQALIKLREKLGTTFFDTTFGYWPWDSIDVFLVKEDVLDLAHTYGVSDARMFAWKV
jgi:hypothetical protein